MIGSKHPILLERITNSHLQWEIPAGLQKTHPAAQAWDVTRKSLQRQWDLQHRKDMSKGHISAIQSLQVPGPELGMCGCGEKTAASDHIFGMGQENLP